MNDFTKEELGYLYDELDSNYSELKNIPLMNKIKSIIDNYCEHESLDDFDLFLPKVGAILTDKKNSKPYQLSLIRNLYLKTVWPDKFKEIK